MARISTLVALIGVVLTAGATTATAHAAPVDESSTATAKAPKVTVKAGAHGVKIVTVNTTERARTAAVPVPAPTVRPSVTREWVPSGGNFSCASGYACAYVPYSNGGYAFKFYDYGTYHLSNWFGTGYVLNNQTGGAAVRLDDQYEPVVCIPPGPRRNGNWDPIWRIRLTASRC